MNAEIFGKAVAMILGMALILMYAFDRFNTPPSNRALTTAARYYLSATLYMLVYLLAYSILFHYPVVLKWALQSLGDTGITFPESLPTSMAGAILLSILIPKLPVLAKVDGKVRKYLQDLAAIPLQALKLSGTLYQSGFSIPGNLEKGLRDKLLHDGFEASDLVFEERDSAEYLWIKNSALLLQIRSWKSDHKFLAFFSERKGQFERLEKRYSRLNGMALNCFDLVRQVSTDVIQDAMRKAVNEFYANFKGEAEDLLNEICQYIAQGVLRCQLTHGARCRELGHMGFKQKEPGHVPRFTVSHVLMLWGFLLFLLLLNFLISAPPWEGREKAMLMVTMISTIYCLSVWCAVYLKEKGVGFKYKEGEFPPVKGYVLSGLAAAVIAVPVTLLFKMIIFAKGPMNLFEAVMEAWKNFVDLSYPWLVMSFVTATATSVLIDLAPPRRISETFWRLLQGGIQAGVTLLAGLLVHWWIEGIYPPNTPVPEKVQVLVVTGAIGLLLGFVVPSWYRAARKRECELEDVESMSGALVAFQPRA